VRADFFRFLDGKAVPGYEGKIRAAYEAEKDPGIVDRAIREELLTAVWGREAGYRATLEGDVQLKKALTLFPDAEKLAALREEARLARNAPPRP